MSDFLVSMRPRSEGARLLDLLQSLYTVRSPRGYAREFPWGAVAMMQDPVAGNRNVVEEQGALYGWVGDLAMDRSLPLVQEVVRKIDGTQTADQIQREIGESALLRNLDGAFAILLTYPTGLCIVTDPVSFVPVYVGRDRGGQPVAFGTQADLVAKVSGCDADVDVVSAGEFLLGNNCTFPHTIHCGVKQLASATVHVVTVRAGETCENDRVYWRPPAEESGNRDEDEWGRDLREALTSAVTRRCHAGGVGVLLSGGLDSRLVMALVPEVVPCMGLTFSDAPNRETRTAARVAHVLGRPWRLLLREEEFLGRNLSDVTRIAGCESFWVDAHGYGFQRQLRETDLPQLLTGFGFDSYLKGAYALDFRPVPGTRGFQRRYEKVAYPYVESIGGFWAEWLCADVLEAVRERRRERLTQDSSGRSSVEWTFMSPFSQNQAAASWLVDRRVMPLSLVCADRRLLEIGFACPTELKCGGRLFRKAIRGLLGPAGRVPNANNGVWPDSGDWRRAGQRMMRKFREFGAALADKCGRKGPVQHSWSDYQGYWRQSRVLSRLRAEHGGRLANLVGPLLKPGGEKLLGIEDLHWQAGFRMLQLAVWQSL